MKILPRVMVALLLLGLAAPALAAPPRWRGSGGWGAGSAPGYDAATVATVTGTVVAVERASPRRGMSPGIHLTLKSGKKTVTVHLGPVWYLESQDVKLEAKDQIEVTGSTVTFEGKSVLLAAEVMKGDETLKLRDKDGVPVWAGWRRRK